MTFLELVKRAYRESGLAGNGPTSVDNQTGMNAKFVDWVREAWVDIQARHDNWKFLRKKDTRTLTVGKRTYDMVSEFNLPNVRKWDEELLFIRDVDAGTRARLQFVEYPEFETLYWQFTSGQPRHFTITPDFQVAFDRLPDKEYAVDLNYWMTGERLNEPGDVPSIPEDYHMTIVWRSLERYGSHDGAVQMKTDVSAEYKRGLGDMERTQLEIPHKIQARPLA